MKKIVYAVVVLAMLALPVSSAFASEPNVSDAWIPAPGYYGDVVLGQPLPFAATGFIPNSRVDGWLFRPPTVDLWGNPLPWPLNYVPNTPPTAAGYAWALLGGSNIRRVTFAETEGTVFERADSFGNYLVPVMLPRDEVWYPCSFPLKWKCNYNIGTPAEEFHSPRFMVYGPGTPLQWPWIDGIPGVLPAFGAASDPQDVISPLWIIVSDYQDPQYGWVWEATVLGMGWVRSDYD
jgi:hypothetical protein